MKKIRVGIALLLLVLVAGAWTVLVTGTIQRNQKFNDLISKADEYVTESLFQKAIMTYEDALKIKESSDIRSRWLAAYASAYEAGDVSKKQYVSAINDALSKSPKNASNWETLIQLSLDGKDYNDAKSYYDKANNAGVKSEKLSELKDEIYYAYSEKNKVYTSVAMSLSGEFSLCDGKKWGVMNPDGTWKFENEYSYAAPVITDSYYLLTTERDSRLVNDDNIAQSIISQSFEKSKAESEGIIPLCNDGKWRFYDYKNSKFILEEYDDVSSFVDGKAVVNISGKWTLIDKSGEKAVETTFDDVIVNDNGDFCYKGIMIASTSGNYSMYDLKGNVKNSFSAKKMDFYYGGLIAFQDKSEKWGFIDSDGKVVISPKYSEAKSFSGGLGAVKVNDKWGFVISSGKEVIEPQFVDAKYFTGDGVCFVASTTGEYHIISLRFGGIS